MANWSNLIAAINAVIKTNGNREITGAVLQNVLDTMVTNMGANPQFGGYVDPSFVPPTNPDGNIFYLSKGEGVYSGFGEWQGKTANITSDTETVMFYNVSGGWQWQLTGQASLTNLYSTRFYLSGNCKVSLSGTTVTFVVEENKLAVFDMQGGYRFIAAGTYTLPRSYNLYLSTDPDSYVAPDFAIRGIGETLYFVTVTYNSSQSRLGLCAAQWITYYTPFQCLQLPSIADNVLMAYKNTGKFVVTDHDETGVTINGANAILNYVNGTYAVLNSRKFANSANSVIVLSKSDTEFIPVKNNEVWPESGFYLWEVSQWSDLKLNSTPTVVLGQMKARYTGEYIPHSVMDGIDYYYNPAMRMGKGSDVNGIRSLCFTEIMTMQLYVEGTRQTIKELWLDKITMDNPNLTNAQIVFGAWTNPENSANKGEYRQVAKATILSSANSLSVIDWKVEPLNDSGLKGYIKTTRAFFNYFYKAGNPNDWQSDGTGTDLFCQFDVANIPVIIPAGGTAEKNVEREDKGILPRLSFAPSPLLGTLSMFDKIKAKDKDVTILQIGDSISTNNLYASPVADAAYRPPRMDEMYLPYYVEQQLRWKGQQYRRSDAMTNQDATTPMFTEVGTGETKYYDAAWDWQITPIDSNYYRLWTRILTGSNCSVTFTVPAGTKRVGFIYRTDYLCAPQTKVTVANGNGIMHIKEADGTLVEANGYTFSMQEADEIITTPSGNLRKSQGQKRLMFWFDVIGSDQTITIENIGDGRLNYWGVEYSPFDSMLYYINVSRGGHNIAKLQAFEAWDVDGFKPDAILMQCMIINEGAVSVAPRAGNTPTVFAQRFVDYINELKGKDYAPEVLPYVLYIGVQAGIVNQSTGAYQCSILNGYGYVDTYKYVGALDKALRASLGYFLNFFDDFTEIAYRKAEIEETGNIWTSAINSSGQAGNTFTVDTVHLNDYGSLIAYRLLKPFLNY